MNDCAGLQAETIRELFEYEPSTGILTWREKRQGCRTGGMAGTVRKDGRIAIMIDGRFYKAHRLVWAHAHGVWPADQIDHINGCPADNRIANLREATAAQNAQNRSKKSSNKSGFLGVSWSKTMRKWQASIEVNGKGHHLGYSDTPQQASLAYAEAKIRLHKFNPEARHGE